MPDTARTWTRETVLALPDDGNRYALFDGELLVPPTPTGPNDERLTWLPEGAAEQFELDLPQYFSEVWGTP